MRRLTEVVVGALLCGVLVAGCGNGSEETDTGPEFDSSPSPSQTDAASSLPAGVPTEPPAAPAGIDSKTVQGARSFSQYVLKMYWYAVSRNDIEPLLALTADGGCPTCKETASNLTESPNIFEVPNGPVQATEVAILEKEGNVWHVGILYDLPDGKRIYADSSERTERIEGAKDSYMELDLRWQHGEWTLAQYRFPKA